MASRQKKRAMAGEAECQRLLARYIEKYPAEAKRIWSEIQSTAEVDSEGEDGNSMIAASRTSLDL
eukprot:6204101-Amphidinium_carterae.1